MWSRLFELIRSAGYPALFFAAFLENLIPPIPSELIMPLWWIMASQWTMTRWWALLCSTFWSVLWTVPYFWIGWHFWPEKIKKLVAKYGHRVFITEDDLDWGYELFDKYGKAIVFFGRFVPLGRWFIWLPAWSAKMPFWQYFIYSVAWTAIWAWFLTRLWWTIWDNFDQIKTMLSKSEHIIAAIVWWLFIWLLVYFYYKKFHKQKNN